MRFLMQIGTVIWTAVTWLFHQMVRLVKWVINKLPGLREGIAKWTQTLLFYVALGTMVLVVCMLPLPLWGKAIGTLGFALLLSSATVVRTRAGISEKDVRVLQDQKAELEARVEKQRLQIEKLKVDMQNQRSRLLDMNWIWEINLAQVRTQYTKVFDYFIRGRNDPVPWSSRPPKFEDGDKRAIGALQIDYTAKVGIDLKQVLVSYDRENCEVLDSGTVSDRCSGPCG